MKQFAQSILPLFGFVFLMQCSSNDKESRSMEQIYKEEGLPVRTEKIVPRPFESSSASYAVLTGIMESTASASVADKIDKIYFHIGDAVNKDDIILSLPTDNPAAQYTQARVNVEHMRTTSARMKALYESGGISRQEYDNVAAQCQVAEANWDAAQQSVLVRAPISGTITQMAVQESDNVDHGDVLFTIARTNQLKAKIWVSENRISDFHKGDAAVARWEGKEIQGRVDQVDISLNAGMQAFGVQLVFDNRGQSFRPGINAEIRVLSGLDHPVIMTARKNLFNTDDAYYVFKVVDSIAVKQPVVIGREADLDVEIIDGLKKDDEIVTEGMTLLEDGQRVRIID